MRKSTVDRLLGSTRVFAWARRWVDRPLLVLCYHDLREAGDLDSWLRVETSAFREHLKLLSNRGEFIQPSALSHVDELQGDGPFFLLTFDDGYSNNLRLAVPILREYDVPALFFVSTHHLITGERFWFDRVVDGVQATRTTRVDLRQFGLRRYRFPARDDVRRWEAIQGLLSDIKRIGNPGTPAVNRVVDHLASLAEQDSRVTEWCRPLRVEELQEMASTGLCHFGSHGHRHEILTLLDEKPLNETLVNSRRILEGLLGVPVTDLAYPNGNHDDRVAAACREAGYERAFGVEPALLGRGHDPFRIPRLLVGGYDSAGQLASVMNRLFVKGAIRAARL